MANISGGISTAKENHSVKEAVLSFITTSPIQQPIDYRSLLNENGKLVGLYHKFEPVKTVEVKMDMNTATTEYRTQFVSGFKFVSFKNGRVCNIIQGLNQPNMGLFTFNTIEYDRWKEFKSNALESAKIISDYNSSYTIRAFSLLFIDEFYFSEGNLYDPEKLFNVKSQNLPLGIKDSAFVDFNLVMKRTKQDKRYDENLSIRVFDEKPKKTISIIENITFNVKPISFGKLLETPLFSDYLDFIHSENKSMLIDILNPEISNLIGLQQ